MTADGHCSLSSQCPTGHSVGANPRPVCVSGGVFSGYYAKPNIIFTSSDGSHGGSNVNSISGSLNPDSLSCDFTSATS